MAPRNTKSKSAPKPAAKTKSDASTSAVSSTTRKDNELIAEFTETISRNNRKAAAAAKNLTDISKELSGVWTSFATVVEESAKTMQDTAKPTIAIKDNFSAIQDAAKDIYANLEDIGEQYYEQVDLSKQIAKAESDIVKAKKRGSKETKATLARQLEQLKALNVSAEMMEAAHEIAVKKGISIRQITQDIVQPMEDLMTKVSQFPGGGFLTKILGVDGKLEKIQKQVMASFVKNLADTGSVGKSAFKALGTGAGSFMKSLGPIALLLGAISAAVALIKRKFKLDQETTELARNLGISRAESGKMMENLKMMSVTTKMSGALKQDFVDAQKALSAVGSTNAEISQTALESQIRLVKQYGLQQEEAAQFQTIAAGTNMKTDQLTNLVRNMTEDYNQLTGDSLNHQEIVKDIAKVSGKQLAAYKGNVKQLVAANIQAKRLGMTLEDTANVSKSLLNFEESIGNEMKANILSGKSLNMNRARGLALQGKSAEAAAEALNTINTEYGDFQNFLDENIITQEAVAASAGMTVDQLVEANNLKKINQELNGREIRDMSELTALEREQLVNKQLLSEADAKELEQKEMQVSMQEQMAKIVDRISSFMDAIVENSTTFSIILGVISGIALMVAASAITTAIATATTMSLLTGGAIALTAAAGVAYMTHKMTSAVGEAQTKAGTPKKSPKVKPIKDGEIAPDGGLVVSGKKGTYQLNRDDTVLAGPGLSSASKQKQRAEKEFNFSLFNVESSGTDMSKVEELLQKLISKVDQPVKIQLGTRVIDTLDKAISVRKTYSTSVDKGYGAFG